MQSDFLGELISNWIDHLRANDTAPNTMRLYRNIVIAFVEWYEQQEHRQIFVDDLTPIALIGYRNELQHNQNKAVRTVNTHVAAIRTWCSWLHESELVKHNPAKGLKFIGDQTSSTSPKGLEDTQINALLRESQHTRYPQRDYAILQVMLQTGMRIGECAALNYQDIQLAERSGSVNIRGGKGNKARSIPLNGSARKALLDYAALMLGVEPTLKAVLAAWPSRQLAQPTPFWASQKGGRMSISAIQRMIDQLVRNCAARGLVPETASAHTLRHTFAGNYLKENLGDVIGLATLLGHNSLDTTRIYSQPTADTLASRIDRLKINAYADE